MIRETIRPAILATLRSMARAWRPLAYAFPAVILLSLPALAQESSPAPEDTPTGHVFRWLNFAIVFALIVWGFSKAVPHFRSNAGQISAQIAEGARAREAAEQQRRQVQEKIAGIPQEVETMRADAKRSMQAEGERLRALAKVEAEAIERAAQAEIAAAERAARLELKAIAADLAIERAEAVLRDELGPEAEAVLFRGFVADLNGSPN
jgi:F-type H+-transporting ATPase subunit b